MARTNSMRIDGPYPQLVGSGLNLASQPEQTENPEAGIVRIDHSDGSTTIRFGDEGEEAPAKKVSKKFYANLAEDLDDEILSKIANDLLEGIKRDEESRKDWLETRATGLKLLGLHLEKPRSDAGQSSAPLEGISTVRHPLLLEATVSFQATARAELLPASGPVKVRNDTPYPPPEVIAATLPQAAPPQDPNNPQPPAPPAPTPETPDDLAQALEKDLNHYLTAVATEYVPDTDRMLFNIGFGGDGFKKIYNCPLRRRPVSESVDAEDLIVSNAATDLDNCSRITHKIKMRKSVLRRMQIVGEYLDVDLTPPQQPEKTPVDAIKNQIAGNNPAHKLPEDRDYEMYEVYCELDLEEFAPPQFKGKGLPLPYVVTLEKESRKVLNIRRNWKEKDKECCAKKYFVQFPLIRGVGFYGLGYIHLLGNTTVALTGAWRMQLDSGMFANFPGFLYAKTLSRQLTNQFRVPPGGGMGLEIPANSRISDAVMPLPYKEVGPSFSAFVTHVEEVGRRLASTANIQVGEGKQDAPVGTTLALLEQASKVLDSSHKRLHAAQAQEFELLVERFREDPEAFWRHNPKTTIQWEKKQFLKALEDHKIVPVADPNNPTSLHRMAKGMAVKELQKGTPELYDPKGVDLWVLRNADINPEGLFRPIPATPPPDPRLVAIQQKAQSADRQNQIQLLEAQIKAATAQAQMQDNAQDRASRERLENMKLQLEMLKIQEERLIHARDMQNEQQKHVQQLQMDAVSKQHELQMSAVEKAHDLHHDRLTRMHDLQHEAMSNAGQFQIDQLKQRNELKMAQQRHEAEMNRAHEEHQMKMQHERELHAARLEAAKKMATVAKRDKSKPAKKEG